MQESVFIDPICPFLIPSCFQNAGEAYSDTADLQPGLFTKCTEGHPLGLLPCSIMKRHLDRTKRILLDTYLERHKAATSKSPPRLARRPARKSCRNSCGHMVVPSYTACLLARGIYLLDNLVAKGMIFTLHKQQPLDRKS